MKLYNAGEIRAWDAFTMRREPVDSIDLMERAAMAFVRRFAQLFPDLPDQCGWIVCGAGNNGGDGLAIGRLLFHRGYTVRVILVDETNQLSPDCRLNLERLQQYSGIAVHRISKGEQIPEFQGAWLIDSLFGTGLSRAPEGIFALMIHRINASGIPVVSVDIPSGLYVDRVSRHDTVRARYTLTFQVPKLAFLFPEHAGITGHWEIVDIGLHDEYLLETDTAYNLTDNQLVGNIYRPRSIFSHKGNYGHSLLAGGSRGKTGAILLSAKAALRSGSGLVSILTPDSGRIIVQSAVPEAMWIPNENTDFLLSLPALPERTSFGIGPGMGQEQSAGFLRELFTRATSPLVLDADGLNLVAANPELLGLLPAGSILTPHPKEFDRLFGNCADTPGRISRMTELSKAHSIILVLKGHHTIISTPDGQIFFNSSGNAGMATGGSGDVLTGILTALLAQGYSAVETAVMGVWIHGRAGDSASAVLSQEALIASDIIDHLGAVFLELQKSKV